MKKVKTKIPQKLKKGIPLSISPGHTTQLELSNEPLTVHTGLSLYYAMAEALNISQLFDKCIHVKERESGYPESEHILALSANAFVGGEYLDDLKSTYDNHHGNVIDNNPGWPSFHIPQASYHGEPNCYVH